MAADKIQVMHLTGQSNKYHSWKGTGDAINQHQKIAAIFDINVVTSTEANPVHQYKSVGNHVVVLRLQGPTGESKLSKVWDVAF